MLISLLPATVAYFVAGFAVQNAQRLQRFAAHPAIIILG
jgi:hypothetical protein